MQKPLCDQITRKIRSRRLELGYSQDYMAAKLQLGQNCYSKIELGQNKLTVDRLIAIAALLGLSPSELLGEQKDTRSDFSKLFHLSQQPMWVFEPVTLKFIEVNDAAVRNYGYSKADFYTMSIREIRPREDLPLLQGFVRELDKDRPFIRAVRHQHRNGSLRNVLINCHSVEHEHGLAFLVMPEAIQEGMTYVQQLKNTIFEQNSSRKVGDGQERSRFTELRFLAGQLNEQLPEFMQATLIEQIKNLLDTKTSL